MSTWYVRDLTYKWLEDPAVAAIMPFYRTINWDQTPNDLLWFTVSFDPFGSIVEDYCGHRIEDGEIRLIFFGDHGIGEENLIKSAQNVADMVVLNTDPNARLLLDPPSPPIGYGDVPFAVEIPILYRFYL